MAVKAILNIVVTAGVFAIFVGVGLAVFNASRGRKTRSGVVIAVIGLIVALIVGPLNAGLVLIQPNERGVVFRQTAQGDAALLEPIQPGLHWVIPFVDQVIEYDIGRRSLTMAGEGLETGGLSAVQAISSDGQIINIDATIVYRVDPLLVNDIHRNWRGDFENGFIVPQARSEIRNAISEYGAEAIYSGGRAALETQITDNLTTVLQDEGFQLVDVLIRNIVFSPQFAEAIENKQIADQEAQQAERRVVQAQQEAEQRRAEAEGLRDAAIIAAEGEGQAILIRAEAEAEGLKLINEALAANPNLIQWQYINQLGDQVELVIIPSNSPFLFDLEQLLEQAEGQGVEVTSTPAPIPNTDGE